MRKEASLLESSGEPGLLGGPLEPCHVPAGKSGPRPPSAVSPPLPAPGGICVLRRWMSGAPGGIYAQLLLNMFAKGCPFKGEHVQTAAVTQAPAQSPGNCGSIEIGHGVKDGFCCLGSFRMLESHTDVPVPGF